MTVSTENARERRWLDQDERRAGRELVLDLAFRPLSNMLVPRLARLRVAPSALVLANAVAGLLGAALLARGELIAGALLLQVKTLLDNTDGQLARASGRVTLAGRYLDTEVDLVVNAAVFVALGHVTGRPLVAVASFVALTLVLAVDFNVTELHREALGTPTAQPPPTGGIAERVLGGVYHVVLAPLDRAIRARAARSNPREAPYDELTLTILANLGLSTQFAVLGVCLVAGAPSAYLWFVVACFVTLVPLHVRSERRSRRSKL